VSFGRTDTSIPVVKGQAAIRGTVTQNLFCAYQSHKPPLSIKVPDPGSVPPLNMSTPDNKMANIDSDTTEQEHVKTEVAILGSSADPTAVDPSPPRSKKSVAIERLILCTALFFPLFLATLDTSTIQSLMC
jgi:hypothetical protein